MDTKQIRQRNPAPTPSSSAQRVLQMVGQQRRRESPSPGNASSGKSVEQTPLSSLSEHSEGGIYVVLSSASSGKEKAEDDEDDMTWALLTQEKIEQDNQECQKAFEEHILSQRENDKLTKSEKNLLFKLNPIPASKKLSDWATKQGLALRLLSPQERRKTLDPCLLAQKEYQPTGDPEEDK